LSLSYLAQQEACASGQGGGPPRRRPGMPRAPGRRAGGRSTETFLDRLPVQLRVLAALVLRELRYRAVHSRFGILSVMVPQAIQIVTLGVVLSFFNNGRPPLGDHLFFFYATGVMPFYMFIHVMDHSQNQFLDNIGVLQIPLVTRLDVVLGMAIAELLINAATVVATFGAFALFSYGPSSDNHIEAVYAMLAVWLFAFGLGLISAVANNLYRPWSYGWLILQRFLYVASGVFYIPQSMPDWIRDALAWNPLLQGIEWFRTGFFRGYDPPWLDKPYLLGVAFATVVVGMMLERTLRRKMKYQ
jgi:capsular polysaccharide transport system permease protein